MKENQLSRWGAISKQLPLMNPEAKVFILANTSATYFGELSNDFPPDKDGTLRVHSTIATVIAEGDLQANRGDVVLALPGFAQTLTATQSLSVAGVRWIGIGEGTLKPTITVNVADHGIGISAANVEFNGFHFAAPATDAAKSMIRIAAAGAKVRNISGIGSDSTNNFVDCINFGTGVNDHLLENIDITTGNVAVVSFLNFEAPCSRSTIGGLFLFGSTTGAGIIDGANGRIKTANWKDINVSIRGATGIPALTLDAAGSYGMVRSSFFAGTHTTLASNAAFGTGWRLNYVNLLEEIDNSKQGVPIPAVDVD